MQWQKAELIEHVCDIKALQRKEETMLSGGGKSEYLEIPLLSILFPYIYRFRFNNRLLSFPFS